MESRSDNCDIEVVELDVEVKALLPDGMEHFSSEVRQFCGFIVCYFVDWQGGLDEAWVSCHDAVHVLPHLLNAHTHTSHTHIYQTHTYTSYRQLIKLNSS